MKILLRAIISFNSCKWYSALCGTTCEKLQTKQLSDISLNIYFSIQDIKRPLQRKPDLRCLYHLYCLLIPAILAYVFICPCIRNVLELFHTNIYIYIYKTKFNQLPRKLLLDVTTCPVQPVSRHMCHLGHWARIICSFMVHLNHNHMVVGMKYVALTGTKTCKKLDNTLGSSAFLVWKSWHEELFRRKLDQLCRTYAFPTKP